MSAFKPPPPTEGDKPAIPNPVDVLRDPRAMVDAGLGPVAFVAVNALAGLNAAAATAVAISLLLAAERLVRRKPVTNALAGLFATGVAVFIAVRTGRAEGYFIPKAVYQGVLAVVFLGSVLIGRPVGAYLAQAIYRTDAEWARHPAVRRATGEMTLAWAALFGVRAVLMGILIAAGRVGWLATVSLLLGWPCFLALVWLTYRYVPRRLDQLGAPPPTPSDPAP